jgi:hypothetical protein
MCTLHTEESAHGGNNGENVGVGAKEWRICVVVEVVASTSLSRTVVHCCCHCCTIVLYL